MKLLVDTHVTFITREPVCLSWPVSRESLLTVNSLSSTSVMGRFCFTITIHADGGCHVILLRWGTGVEHLEMVSAHAEWPNHVQTPVMVVTVIRMTMYDVKTAVFSLTRQSFQWNSSGLEILVTKTKKASSHSENLNATALYERRFYYETEASCSHDQGVLHYALRTAKNTKKQLWHVGLWS